MGVHQQWAISWVVALGLGVAAATPSHAASGVNNAPVAVPDTVATKAGVGVQVDPLANDSDAEGDVLFLIGTPSVQSGAASVTLVGVGPELMITPTPGTTSPILVAYTVSDGPSTTPGVITVDVINSSPVARADNARVVSGRVLQVDPRANDSDADGEELRIATARVASGSGSVTTDGRILTVRPAVRFLGLVVVSYTVSDPRGATARTTVTVEVVRAPNRRPIAKTDSVTVKAGKTVLIRVLANDTDPDRDRITLIKVAKPSLGKASVSGSRIKYTAPRGFRGSGRLTYVIRDSLGATVSGTLKVKVTWAPVAATAPSRKAIESAMARLRLPGGSVDGFYDTNTARALCVWRTVSGRTVHRGVPSAQEARAIVSTKALPTALPWMVRGLNVSRTCQSVLWVRADRTYIRAMPASTGKAGYATRLGTHRIFVTHHVWRNSTIYPEARMYKPMQFSGGQALHGSATDQLVKTYPASHGCVRMLHQDIDAMQAGGVGNGTLVKVFGAW